MVKRYYPVHCDGPRAEMVDYPDGEWVSFDDYQDKCDDYVDLKIKYDSLVRDLGNLYRDA